MKKGMRIKERVTWVATFSAASAVFGIGFNIFLIPHEIVLGGATGIATVLRVLFGLPVGLVTIAVNFPLLVFYAASFGIRRIGSALGGILATSVAVDLFAVLPAITDDKFVAAIFGGAVMGVGVGMLLRIGVTTGGSDLAAYIIHEKKRSVSVGGAVLVIDGTIIVGAAIALGSFDGLVYSIVTAVVYSLTIDRTVIGANRARLVFVMCADPDRLSGRILDELERGVTVLYGKGGYTDADRPVLMCAVKSRELYRLKRLINDSDPSAFMIITDATEVLGEGFGNNNG